jgi:hypothetical protein
MATLTLIVCLVFLAPWTRAQQDAGSNALPAEVWFLTDLENATARLDLHLWCPWTAATNRSSWFFRSGSTNDASRLGIASCSRSGSMSPSSPSLGEKSRSVIEYGQRYVTTSINVGVKWTGSSQGKQQRISTSLAIPPCMSTAGAVEYVNYHRWAFIIPFGEDATSGVVERLNYKAIWTTKPGIGPMWLW